METKKILFSSLAMLFIAPVNYAMNICPNLPGHWQGFYTIKNKADCEKYKGCTHLILADVIHKTDINYHVSLRPSAGKPAEIDITCDNGSIHSPENPNNVISVACDEKNHCFVKYEDPVFRAEMLKS